MNSNLYGFANAGLQAGHDRWARRQFRVFAAAGPAIPPYPQNANAKERGCHG